MLNVSLPMCMWTYNENDPCYICEDKQRDRSVICVVEDDKDVIAMEKMRVQRSIMYCMDLSPRWMALGLKILISQL